MSNKQSKSALVALQDRVARIYYTHGLFCSTHPIPVITFASAIILLCCYPIVYLPIPGNVPQEYVSPFKSYSLPPDILDPSLISTNRESIKLDGILQPRWYHGAPVGFVQQIVVRASVSPWTEELSILDVFKASLSKAFDIMEIIKNFQLDIGNSSIVVDDLCLHISEPVMKNVKDHLPSYGCLIVSPANIWSHDMQKFLSDQDLIHSVLSLGQKPTDQLSGLNNILFGVPWRETAIKKFYIRNRQRIVSFAVTIVLQKYDPVFIQGLEERLHRSFPFLHYNETISNGNLTHIHFHSQYTLVEFIPLLVTYVILFLYIYFSVRKIEMVKSKLGMAFSAVITVVASLCMSVGLCTWFGLSFTIKAEQVYLKDIFPYLVVIIGLENILVLTKSVVSTPVNLDVKVRLAQGLSKEGWSITKNLVTELSILTFGFFTFVPAIQEFCFFAVVGLLSDFFLQLVFFATILAVDIGRMEISDLHRQCLHQSLQPSDEELTHMYPLFRWPLINRWHRAEFNSRLSTSRPVVTATSESPTFPANVVAPPYSANSQTLLTNKVPKRLRLVYFWARCRIFQKAFMACFIVWVMLIGYKSGIVNLFAFDNSTSQTTASTSLFNIASMLSLPIENSTELVTSATVESNIDFVNESTASPFSLPEREITNVDIVHSLKHKSYDLWRHLLHDHWPMLFGFYNISLKGRYISILPSIKLSYLVNPEEAIRLRQTTDLEKPSSAHWFSNPLGERPELSDADDTTIEDPQVNRYSQAYYPSSPAEVVLTVILAIPSIVFLVYVMVVFYQCICSRNYAEWRSSWSEGGSHDNDDVFTQLVIEAMPVVLDGHPQEVECLATDANLVVSSCLAGEIRVWDSTSGECLSIINRKRCSPKQKPHHASDNEGGDDLLSDCDSGSPPSSADCQGDTFNKNNITHCSKVTESDERSHSYYKSYAGSCRSQGLPCNRSSDDLFVSSGGEQKSRKQLFNFHPDLSATINTEFTKLKTNASSKSKQPKSTGEFSSVDEGFDFGHFKVYFDEHQQLLAEEQDDFTQKQVQKGSGEISPNASHSPNQNGLGFLKTENECLNSVSTSVWCIDCKDNLIVAGCSDGKIEFWDTLTGTMKHVFDDALCQGITGIRIFVNRVVAVRINGGIDFLELSHHSNVEHQSLTQTGSKLRRAPAYYDSESCNEDGGVLCGEHFTCCKVHSARAHQQAITVLEVEGGKAVTGSQDHTLKVFRVSDTLCLSTLHGHYGPITTLFIDKFSPMIAASGSQDGAVCLWDLQTCTCICRLRGHDGSVTALSYTASYVLSSGTDNKLFVWERFQGHLLNTINLQQSYCGNIIMLTDNLLLTGHQGSLGVWDIRMGDPVRIVQLGHADDRVLVRQIRHVGHTIVCDYGKQLRVVRFPAIVEKVD